MWALLIAAGSVAGFSAGLLGGSGAFIIVPVLIIGLPQFTGAALPQIAIATSLTVLIPTSIASAQAHSARGTVDVRMCGLLAPSITAGGLLGARIAPHMNASVLMLLFVGFALIAARRFFRRPASAAPAERRPLTRAGAAVMMTKGLSAATLFCNRG